MDSQAIKNIITEFLDKLTLEYSDVTIEDDEIHPVFVVHSSDSSKMIGMKGENLRAVNYIVKRIVEKKLGYDHPSFLVDVNGYQQKRNEEIRTKAKMLIERVRNFKTSVEMEPMNAYERMLVHSLVTDDPEIETESIGEGKVKTLVIKYKEVTDVNGF